MTDASGKVGGAPLAAEGEAVTAAGGAADGGGDGLTVTGTQPASKTDATSIPATFERPMPTLPSLSPNLVSACCSVPFRTILKASHRTRVVVDRGLAERPRAGVGEAAPGLGRDDHHVARLRLEAGALDLVCPTPAISQGRTLLVERRAICASAQECPTDQIEHSHLPSERVSGLTRAICVGDVPNDHGGSAQG